MAEQAFTLYFDISEDKHPTLGAIARASLAMEKMAEETLFLAEPGVYFEILFDRSEPGSLRLISRIKGVLTKERLKILTIALAIQISYNAVNYLQTKGMDEIYDKIVEENPKLSQEDVERISKSVAETLTLSLNNRTVVEARTEFFSAVQTDPAIIGVGIRTDDAPARPASMVPRDDFESFLTKIDEILEDEGGKTRTTTIREEVVLDTPVLSGAHRKWRFFGKTGKISAYVEADQFLRDLRSDKIDVNLSGGIILDVTRVTIEEQKDGLWITKKETITEVHSWRRDFAQAEFILSHHGDDGDEDN